LRVNVNEVTCAGTVSVYVSAVVSVTVVVETVKVVEALAPPESVATMVFGPPVTLGTVKVAVHPPVADTVSVPLMVRAAPPKVTPLVALTVLPAM
jgi:hypothetical protein